MPNEVLERVKAINSEMKALKEEGQQAKIAAGERRQRQEALRQERASLLNSLKDD